VRVERRDGRTAAGWAPLANGADAIVNLAGANLAGEGFFPSLWTDERKRLIRKSRINAGHAVVAAAEQASVKPRVVIQASGIGCYGFRGEEQLVEDAPAGKDFLVGVAHEKWEPSGAPGEAMGGRRAIIRSRVVLSAKEGALLRQLLPFRLFVGGPIDSGKQWFTWIHPADQIAGMRFLIENDNASGPFNLCAPNPVTNAQLSRAIGRVLNRPSWLPLPGFAMRLSFGEVSDLLLEGQRGIPKRLEELGFAFRYPTVEVALHDIVRST
jgi:uncharacterized protein (TIGR01777 family)